MKGWQRAALLTVPIVVLAVVALWSLLRPPSDFGPDEVSPVASEEGGELALAPEAGTEHVAAAPLADPYDGPVYSTDMAADRRIFEERMAWARAERLDTLPVGEIVARMGRTFVGTTYTPNSLDVAGPERLVVNLRELDCVTYVENLLAMARMIRAGQDDFETFLGELARIRYRQGRIEGYASRLHYFTDWIADNESLGLVEDITSSLGGELDDETIDFMTSNPDAYRQLADPETFQAIAAIERRLSARPFLYIPQGRIAEVEGQIRDGDIIAATSSLEGLDVSHTGIALWVDGRLHLMHAPLVGRDVEISERPLAERIQGIRGQDGIIVLRPIG